MKVVVADELVPAPLEKALYEVAAKIPGVTVGSQNRTLGTDAKNRRSQDVPCDLRFLWSG